MSKIDISYIITVYNKEEFLLFLINNLLQQQTNHTREFIFVDDNSSDNSVSILEKYAREFYNFKIIKNSDNKGPSIRLNEGVQKSRGQYLYLLDADELIPLNATECLINLIKSNNVDLLYGKKIKTNHDIKCLNPPILPEILSYDISEQPLKTVLSGKYVGMGMITTRVNFDKAEGCDSKIFIQDESLPIRLSYAAKKMITLRHNVVFAPKAIGLSANKNQQHHDRFMVYYNSLMNLKIIDNDVKLSLYKRAVSSAWKAQKREKNLILKVMMLLSYFYTRTFAKSISRGHLESLRQYVSKLDLVRKI